MKESKRRVVVIAVVFAAGLVIGAVWHWARLFPVSAIGAFKLRVVTLLRDEDASYLTAGRWRKNPDFVEIDEEHKRAIQRLRSVGYVSGSQRAPDASGVTMHDESRAWEGLNLVVSGHAPEAYMMDMAGEVVHRWTCDVYKAWPDFDVEEHFGSPGTNMHTFWHRAHLMPNGDLLAIFDGIGIVKLDKQSNVLWRNRNGAHHDLYVAENGDIYLLTRRTAINPKHNPVEPILEEFITVLDPGGSELRDFSVFDALRNSPFRSILGRLAAKGDIFHTNTIELVESAPGHHESPFRAGSVLISVRQLSLVCAVDMDTEIVYWAESDRWQLQHQPTLLENGNMLIFGKLGLIFFTLRGVISYQRLVICSLSHFL